MVAMGFWLVLEIYYTESWLSQVIEFDANIFFKLNAPHYQSDPVEPREEGLDDDGEESDDEYYQDESEISDSEE